MNWLTGWLRRRENRDVAYILHMTRGGIGFVGMAKEDGCVFIDCPRCYEQDGYVGSKVYPREFAILPPGAKRYENPEKIAGDGLLDLVHRFLRCSEGHEWVVSVWRKSLGRPRKLALLSMFTPGSGWTA